MYEKEKLSDSVDSESKALFFHSKWTFQRILRVSVRTSGIALFVYVCYLYAVLYSDQETSSESKHMFSHLLDGYHEFIFGKFIILSFSRQLCRFIV